MKSGYTDDDPMPFGQYGPKTRAQPSGEGRKLSQVPAGYLLWIWQQRRERPITDIKLYNYLENSLQALKEECPDWIE